MKIHVQCYSGHRVDESPRSIQMGDSIVEVTEVEDRWLAPDHRYFKCIGIDKATYIIRQEMVSLEWELIFYKQADAPQPQE